MFYIIESCTHVHAPESVSSEGKYEVTVESNFETKKLVFDVVLPSEDDKPTRTIIEKVNSHFDSEVIKYIKFV